MPLSKNSTTTTVTATLVGSANPMGALELAHACGADLDWVTRLVALGIIDPDFAHATIAEWCFVSADLRSALDARRLERDFGVELDAVALILDLQHEIRRLKAELQALGR